MRVISSAASRSWPAIRRTSSTFIPLMAFTAGFPSPWLARPRCAPVERSCSGGAVAGVLVDSLTLERGRSEEHTSELQSRGHLVCRLLLEKKQYHLMHIITT